MTDIDTLLPFIYGAVSILLIILLWIGYMVFRLKRRIFKEYEKAIQPSYQQYTRQFPQQPTQQYQNYQN